MTRCAASFSNCCPSPAAVTINNTAHIYELDGNEIGWRQEVLTTFVAVSAGEVTHPVTGAVLQCQYYASLGQEAASPFSVLAFLGNTVTQKPLLSYTEDSSLDPVDFNYFVIADKLYLNFEVVTGDSIFVSYVGTPEAGTTYQTEVGSMANVLMGIIVPETPLSYVPDGWVVADGETTYSKVVFAELYAHLLSLEDASGTVLETLLIKNSDGAVLFGGGTVPVGAFAIKYLEPFTFAPTEAPPLAQDANYRVIVKA